MKTKVVFLVLGLAAISVAQDDVEKRAYQNLARPAPLPLPPPPPPRPQISPPRYQRPVSKLPPLPPPPPPSYDKGYGRQVLPLPSKRPNYSLQVQPVVPPKGPALLPPAAKLPPYASKGPTPQVVYGR